MNPRPQNLRDWQKAAREQQLRYLETKEFMGKNMTSSQQTFTKCLCNQNYGSKPRDPNVMDVDAGTIQFQKLTDEERKELSAKGAYFHCCKQEHMSRQCPNNSGSAEYERPAPTKIKEQERERTLLSVDEALKGLKELLKDKDNKEKYFTGLIDQGFV